MSVPRAVAVLIGSRLENLLSNPRLIGAVILLIVSFGSMVVTGAKGLAEQEQRHTLELQKRLGAALQPLGPSGRQVEPALRVVRPPAVAAVLIAGQERSLPAGWDVGPAAVEALPPYPALSAPTLGTPTDGAAFIAQFGGLLALTLGLTTVLGDRRRGWADAERGTALPASVFWLTHLVAACLVLAVAVGFWFGTVGLVMKQMLDHEWPEANQTLLMVALLTWLYLVTLYGYGSAIGWYVQAPLKAVATAIACWVGLVWVGPQLVSSWSGWAVDLPSRASAEEDQRQSYTDRVRQQEDELGRQVSERFSGNKLPAIEFDRQVAEALYELDPTWVRGMADARAVADALDRKWRAQAQRVNADLQLAARLTPNTLLAQALAEVSGTGSLTRLRWEEAVDHYKRRLNSALFDDRPTVSLRLPIDGSAQFWMHSRHRVKPLRDLPQFVAPTISLQERRAAASPDVVASVLHALAALITAWIAHRRTWRRYDFASLSAPNVGRP